MLEKATRLCGAAFGILNTYEDARFRTVTLRGVSRPLQEFLLQFEAPPPAPESPPGRIIDGEDVVQVDDLAVLEGNRDARGRAMVEKAHSLCGAPSGSLQLYDGQHFRAVATRGMPEPFAALLRQGYRPQTTNARLLGGDSFVQVVDMAEIAARMPGDRLTQATVEVAGIRTLPRVGLPKAGR